MFSKKLNTNIVLVLMLLVGLVVFTACADTSNEPAVVIEEPGMVQDEGLVQDEPLVAEEPLVEEQESIVQDEPLVEEEGIVQDEPLAQEGVVGEDTIDQDQALMADTLPVRVSQLMGNNIWTQANENLGTVEDVVIGLQNNIHYAIVAFDDQGILDFGEPDARRAVPLTALQPTTEDDAFYFRGDAMVLQNAPAFTEDHYGTLAETTWDDGIFGFWQQEQELALIPETGAQATTADTPAFVRASRLIDQDLVNPAGEDLGYVEEIVLWPQQNQGDYAIVAISEGWFDFTADERLAIPLSQFNIAVAPGTAETAFTYGTDPAMLEQAPRLRADDTTYLTDPIWHDQFRTYWGVPDRTAGVGAPVMQDRRAFYGESELLTAEDQFPILMSELIGDDVMTLANEDLGQVDDVILGLRGNPHYLVVQEPGGFLGLGAGESVIIPLAALQPAAEEDTFYFSGDASMFEGAPRFEDNMWDTIGTPGWEDQFHLFWRDQNVFADRDLDQDQAMTQETTTAAVGYLRGSELLDIDILNTMGDDIGDVENIMLTPYGTDFVILSFDEGFGAQANILEGEVVPVPLDQLNFTADNVFNLNFDPVRLNEAPRFTRDEWDVFDRTTWNNDTFTNFWQRDTVVD